MTITKTFLALAVSTSILAASMGVAAAGPMQSLSLSKEGIDIVPVEVSALGGSFKKIKSTSHKFHLKIYAKAKPARKVKVAQVTTSDSPYLEADPGTWSQTYKPNKRTFSQTLSPIIAMSKIRWSGPNPVQACNNKLKNSRKALTKGTTAQVTAYFQLHATNKKGLKGLSDSKHNSTWIWYPVQVKCLPNTIGDKIGS